MNFCFIEDDIKTKEYVKLTIDAFRNGTRMESVDNKIQFSEIQIHCNINQDWDKEKLQCEWIINNGENFRVYLNTIKLLSLVIMCEDININDMSDDEYQKLRTRINGSGKLLDYIFVK